MRILYASKVVGKQDSWLRHISRPSLRNGDGIYSFLLVTMVLGRTPALCDVVLRVYDKIAEIKQQSANVWFYALWGQEDYVWRIEWQVRKALLRSYEIQMFADRIKGVGSLYQNPCTGHSLSQIASCTSSCIRRHRLDHCTPQLGSPALAAAYVVETKIPNPFDFAPPGRL